MWRELRIAPPPSDAAGFERYLEELVALAADGSLDRAQIPAIAAASGSSPMFASIPALV